MGRMPETSAAKGKADVTSCGVKLGESAGIGSVEALLEDEFVYAFERTSGMVLVYR